MRSLGCRSILPSGLSAVVYRLPMNRFIKVLMTVAAAFALYSAPVSAAEASGGSALLNESAGSVNKYSATLTMGPEWATTVRMMLSSSIFGSLYLISRRRK